MNKLLPARPTYQYTEEDWNQLRAHFMSSILVDTHLHKLAQNIGCSWPVKDKEETPARYLDYSFADLMTAPALKGQPARFQLLLDILKETASFDNPFQEMVPAGEPSQVAGGQASQWLRRVAVPLDYPVELTALSPDTRSLCHGEGAETILTAASLFQGMAQSVIVGGEVRQLLNGLAHADLHALARYLPVRPGARGIFLAEGIGVLLRSLTDSSKQIWLSAGSDPEHLPPAAEAVRQQLQARLMRLLPFFPEESGVVSELAQNGEALDRFFVSLGDPDLERGAALLIRCHFPPVRQNAPEGFFGRLSKLFRAGR
jgi:hypothetical protein